MRSYFPGALATVALWKSVLPRIYRGRTYGCLGLRMPAAALPAVIRTDNSRTVFLYTPP